ncbi:AAA family ATPase [Asaia krungthepensis]|uniref:Chromosome partition protein Smc n=1 Tax=Asaia krungthepensis NRIC 0535 TaxID=1307925 RepID=A0ABQ0Q587_9PROT|nr:AAA family ATPase [Asaia krungthepensis]GBQ92066.1 chromosome segregation protein SMC [Asaia krungthepensis NRIC 0535]
MSAKITRLRIAGFKSFADPATIDILPGLTGIVGPNGCGKSNVVEALRWAMGESSARALRGGELDDLIFAGTSARAARSLAEVTLWLEDATGLAPHPFGEADGLEICRRAERGSGSDFRLNGRALRARDITTMFADLSSGARSSSIVSQNRVSALISAKPEERRSLLEEAAGISGLHARRHDAELKLRQAEGNIERSEDLRQQIELRLEQLDAQSTQARAYRGLSEAIRDDEAALSWLVHKRAALLVERTEALLAEAERQRDEAGRGAETAEKASASHKERVLSLRETVETLRAARDRLRVTTETIRESLTQSRAACAQTRSHQEQRLTDQSIARARIDEAITRRHTLQTSLEELDALLAALPETLVEKQEAARQSAIALSDIATEVARRSETLARDRLAAETLAKDHESSAQRLATLETEETALSGTIATLQAEMPDEAALQTLQSGLDEKRQTRQRHERELTVLTKRHQDARLAVAAAEQSVGQARRDSDQTRETLKGLAERHDGLLRQITSHEAELSALEASRMDDEALAREDSLVVTLRQALDEARRTAEACQEGLTRSQQAQAEAEAEAGSIARQYALLEKEHEQAQQACARHDSQSQVSEDQRRELLAGLPDQGKVEAARLKREETEARLQSLNFEREALSAERNTCQREWDSTSAASQTAAARLMALQTQHEALQAVRAGTLLHDPLVETLVVPAGLERAVAVALDQTLEASLDASESRAWVILPELEARSFPPECQVLHTLMSAPPALSRCLSGIALVENEATGRRLQSALLPGQCLVSRDGALWRWDGYRDTGTLPSGALGPVETMARLRKLEDEIQSVEAELPGLRAREAENQSRYNDLTACLGTLREAMHRDETLLPGLRREEEALLAQQNRVTGQLALLEERRSEAAIQHEEAQRRAENASAALKSLPSRESVEAKRSLTQRVANAAREAHTEAQAKAREAETAHSQAREHATRLRLQEEARSAKTVTLRAVLGQAHLDRQDVAARRTELEARDHETTLDGAQAALRSRRDMLQTIERELEISREASETLGREIGAAARDLQTRRDLRLGLTSRLSALIPQHDALVRSLETLHAHRESLSPVPDLAPSELELARCREAETARREQDQACQRSLRETESNLTTATQEKAQIILRRTEADSLIKSLEDDLARLAERVTEGTAELARVEAEAARLEMSTEHNADALREAESDFSAAAEALAEIDLAIEALTQTHREEEQRCATARETAIRLQERLEQARAQLAKLAETRVDLPEQSFDLPLTEQSETTLKRRLSRNEKEREALGPVNLLAEQEYADARSQSDHLAREHAELESAINRLRGSINALKKEGRERLQSVFVEVDRHFQSLFSRMFNGGKAHLGLVGSDDPLEAGLEIFAQPPGKKLSTLSLLSGGEQALTALSLIFATFKCQPSPLCILDEVDAPLDDANVERLCGLLKDMAEEAQTRFLIVTHHQLTMAHMDRLFGVTMQERGVSQVLSVDLSLAASFAESGSLAVVP